MSQIFFELGFDHLTEPGAWDHQLFLATIALAYAPVQWRKWLLLATIFAVGHTASIAFLSAGVFPENISWAELAIALSIVILSAVDLFFLNKDPLRMNSTKTLTFLSVLIFIFGLIHGLGFGSQFLSLIESNEVLTPFGEPQAVFDLNLLPQMLIAFTLGVEAGQILILGIFWLISYLVFEVLQIKPILIRKILLAGIMALGMYIFYHTL